MGKTSFGYCGRAELRRAFFTARFPASVLMMFLLWFINAMRFTESEDVLYLSIHTWGRSIVQLLEMIIASFPYVTAFAEDRGNHMLRYCVLRESRMQYAFSKTGACFCSAAAVIVAGGNFFLMAEAQRLPVIAEHSIAAANYGEMSGFGFLLPSHPVLYIELQLFMDAVMIGSFTSFALALSTWIRSRNGTFVLPFILYFIFEDVPAILKVSDKINPVAYYVIFGSEQNWRVQLTGAFAITALILVLSCRILYRRMEGEL